VFVITEKKKKKEKKALDTSRSAMAVYNVLRERDRLDILPAFNNH
jgi:hypothetical protein